MLPKIPYSMEKNKSAAVPIGNYNVSSNFNPGDIADSYGISARKFPGLTNRKGREEAYSAEATILAMTVFQGEIVTVRSDGYIARIYVGDKKIHVLEYDGTLPRQLAAINTKLVVYPDKIYIEKVGNDWKVENLQAKAALAVVFHPTALNVKQAFSSVSGRGGVFNADDKSLSFLRQTVTLGDLYMIPRKAGDAMLFQLTRKFTNVEGNHMSAEPGSIEINTIRYLPSDADMSGIQDGNMVYWRDDKGVLNGAHAQIKKEIRGDGFIYEVILSGRKSCSGDIYIVVNMSEDIWSKLQYARHTWISAAKPTDLTPQYITPDDGVETYIYRDGLMLYQFTGARDDFWERITIEFVSWKMSSLDKFAAGDFVYVDGSTLNEGSYKIKNIENKTIYFDVNDPNTANISDEIIEGSIGLWKSSELSGDALAFKAGDIVTISGCWQHRENNISFMISKIDSASIHASAEIFETGTEDKITIARKVPDLDFICERDNRLYGVNNAEKTIYVSALGDPTNMYAYEGVSTDSFAVPVGGEGDFTGCCKYGESVLFFKEDKIYKLTGYTPADFAIDSYDVDGLQAGSDKSPVVINEVLYYKGKNGIFAYTGGIPTLISDNFGEHVFSSAAAGTDGVSYYVSMSEGGKDYLLSYNTRLRLWVREGDERYYHFVRLSDGLYAGDDRDAIYKLNASADMSDSEWMVQFVPFYETIEGKKIYSRLLMRAELPRGSYMIIEVRSDGGPWREAGKIVGANKGIIPIRLPIARCDKFELRLRGKGEFTIHDILREYHVGSEV